MDYFFNKEKGLVVGVEEGEVFLFEKVGAGGQSESPKKERKQRTLKSKKSSGEYGGKTRAIRAALEKDLSVKEIVEELREEFPTITPSDVYVERSKLKKAQSSDTFTGPGGV